MYIDFLTNWNPSILITFTKQKQKKTTYLSNYSTNNHSWCEILEEKKTNVGQKRQNNHPLNYLKMKSIYISLLKSMKGKNLHNQGDLRKKKIIELTSRLTTASTEVELWPKPRNSKKRGFGFLIIKRSIFNIFTNGKKLHCIQVNSLA